MSTEVDRLRAWADGRGPHAARALMLAEEAHQREFRILAEQFNGHLASPARRS